MGPYTQVKNFISPASVEVNCPFCGSSSYKVRDKNDAWTIVQCECGFCYTNPRPSENSIKLFYDKDYFSDERHRNKFYKEDGSIKIPDINMHDARIADIENWFDKRGKLLDIGAARGYFLRTMRERGWEAYGIEIYEEAVSFAKEQFNLDIFCGSLRSYKEEKKFEAICMYQTLEHLPDPGYVLKRSYNMLKEGGIIVIEVPNIEAYDIKHDAERKRLSYDLPRHLNHFSPAILKREMINVGFDVLSIDNYFPQFIIDHSLRKRPKSMVKKEENTAGKIDDTYPMKRINRNWKLRLLRSVSNIYPGWRFTITGRKKK